MKITAKSFVKTLCLLGVTATAVVLFSDSAFAAAKGISQVGVEAVNKSFGATQVMSGGAYIGGTIMSLMGIVSMKNHVEEPGQNKLKNALAQLGLGAALLVFPAITSYVSNSVLTQEGNQGATVQTFKTPTAISVP